MLIGVNVESREHLYTGALSKKTSAVDSTAEHCTLRVRESLVCPLRFVCTEPAPVIHSLRLTLGRPRRPICGYFYTVDRVTGQTNMGSKPLCGRLQTTLTRPFRVPNAKTLTRDRNEREAHCNNDVVIVDELSIRKP